MIGSSFPKIGASTGLCAVIGNPVAHTLSPAMHNAAFQAAGLDYVYLAFAVSDLGGCMAGMRAMENFRGMSVTIPHKISIMGHLDEIDEAARRIGCVNTVVKEKGRLIGAVTDGLGALRAIERTGVLLKGKTVLFAGTGGAARAVAFAMAASELPRRIFLLGRTRNNMETLVRDMASAGAVEVRGGILPDDLAACAAESDLLVNATPVGMYGHRENENSIPGVKFRPGQAVFDMVYRPMKTPLIQEALQAGCTIVYGLEMLLYQAVVQFEMWTGRPAPEDVMRRALVNALHQ